MAYKYCDICEEELMVGEERTCNECLERLGDAIFVDSDDYEYPLKEEIEWK